MPRPLPSTTSETFSDKVAKTKTNSACLATSPGALGSESSHRGAFGKRSAKAAGTWPIKATSSSFTLEVLGSVVIPRRGTSEFDDLDHAFVKQIARARVA